MRDEERLMQRLASTIGVLSWFTGGFLLGLVEVVRLPENPLYSTLVQLLPLLFLAGGIWFVILQYQHLAAGRDRFSNLLREVMEGGWIAVFGVNAGLASINNFSTLIFRVPLPYYFQGISLAQKIIALVGLFALGTASLFASRRKRSSLEPLASHDWTAFWEKPLTNVGFILLLTGVVLGLAQYFSTIVYAGFLVLLAGAMLYLIGSVFERNVEAQG